MVSWWMGEAAKPSMPQDRPLRVTAIVSHVMNMRSLFRNTLGSTN